MNSKISNLRVFATFVVVLGHSIIIFDPGWAAMYGYAHDYQSPFWVLVKKVINLFQMELFFMISGFCFWYTLKKGKSTIAILKDKTVRLLVPFVCVALLWTVPLRYLAQYPRYEYSSLITNLFNAVSLSDSGHLWFLPVLFGAFMLGLMLYRCCKHRFVAVVVPLALYFFSPIIGIYYFALLFKYVVFFCIGMILNQILSEQSRSSCKLLIVIMVVGLMAVGCSAINALHICLKLLVSLAIVLFFYLIVPSTEIAPVRFFDRYSYGIYLFHSPVLYIGMCYWAFLPPPIYISLQLVLSISISILIASLLRKSKLKFIIGEK